MHIVNNLLDTQGDVVAGGDVVPYYFPLSPGRTNMDVDRDTVMPSPEDYARHGLINDGPIPCSEILRSIVLAGVFIKELMVVDIHFRRPV